MCSVRSAASQFTNHADASVPVHAERGHVDDARGVAAVVSDAPDRGRVDGIGRFADEEVAVEPLRVGYVLGGLLALTGDDAAIQVGRLAVVAPLAAL